MPPFSGDSAAHKRGHTRTIHRTTRARTSAHRRRETTCHLPLEAEWLPAGAITALSNVMALALASAQVIVAWFSIGQVSGSRIPLASDQTYP
jgi:hypothetical protein